MHSKPVNILLVEDDEIDAEAITRAFEEQGIINPIFRAGDGVEALQILRGTKSVAPLPRPYIIFLDLNMPRMNGFEFLNEIRHDPTLADSIVWVLTTSNTDRDRTAVNSQRISGYLVKSNLSDEFIHIVEMMKSIFLSVDCPQSKLEFHPVPVGSTR